MSDRRILRRGSFGQDVSAWQRVVGITPDGIFGRQTEASTRAWQASKNLEPDGVVGPDTWEAFETTSLRPPPPPAEPLVPTTRTLVGAVGFWDALRVEWPEATREQAGVLWAHFAGETASGLYCWNWNLGNVKHVKGDGYSYVSLRGVWEGFIVGDEDKDGDADGADRAILIERLLRSRLWELDPSADHAKAVGPRKISMIASPDNAATWFRAYESLASGMASFVAMKRSPKTRYAAAWAYVLAGDPEGYAHSLGVHGYYTADPNVYAAAMRRHYDAWLRGVRAP